MQSCIKHPTMDAREPILHHRKAVLLFWGNPLALPCHHSVLIRGFSEQADFQDTVPFPATLMTGILGTIILEAHKGGLASKVLRSRNSSTYPSLPARSSSFQKATSTHSTWIQNLDTRKANDGSQVLPPLLSIPHWVS